MPRLISRCTLKRSLGMENKTIMEFVAEKVTYLSSKKN